MITTTDAYLHLSLVKVVALFFFFDEPLGELLIGRPSDSLHTLTG